ncbi:MAG: 16S rRNA (uracil(1498)-N(3))-methyltransferase [Alphaproteobacteria bacterium]|nr:16S rRNA (uracil(1498)-N(3))-methyltransferase [Alphaproteobacteria bacterium]
MAGNKANFTRLRLFVEDDLTTGAPVPLNRDQSHYLQNVMRKGEGDQIAVFNGRDGEYWAKIVAAKRGAVLVEPVELLRNQADEPDLWLVFAPIKRTAVSFLTSKATEIGVSQLMPVVTARTTTDRVNTKRLHANAIEAAEQSERLTVPVIAEPAKFQDFLRDWPRERLLLVGDETGNGRPIAEVAGELADEPRPYAVMTGPEGGFAPDELDQLGELPFVTFIGLGPRVLRADTAALATLSVVQSIAGDWTSKRL